MEDAILEFKEISGLDYHDIEKTNLDKKWKSQYKPALKSSTSKSRKRDK
jgi:hypothetical protein